MLPKVRELLKQPTAKVFTCLLADNESSSRVWNKLSFFNIMTFTVSVSLRVLGKCQSTKVLWERKLDWAGEILSSRSLEKVT